MNVSKVKTRFIMFSTLAAAIFIAAILYGMFNTANGGMKGHAH